MNKKFIVQKKLKLHCSDCSAVYQLLEIQTNRINCSTCLEKWKSLLIEYCQEQIILDLTKKEQIKDEKERELVDWIKRIKKEHRNEE